MRRVCVLITARPSYSRFKTALRAIQNHDQLELILIVAASALSDKYGNVVDQIKSDGFSVEREIISLIAGESLVSMAKTTGATILELTSVLNDLNPDCVVTIADRYETMSTAISASYLNIPLIHIQGGEITGNIDEKVRHAITKLSDLHLVSTEKAKERVIKMGEDPSKVFVTGCPSIDIANSVKSSPDLDFNIVEKYGGVGMDLNYSIDGYLVLLQHPHTYESDTAREHITTSLEALEALDIPSLIFWPNVDGGSDGTSKGIRTFREIKKPAKMRFYKNFSPSDFLKVLLNCKCLVGNSSVGIRECSYLGVPVVNVGGRQFKRDRGSNVFDVSHDKAEIISAIEHQINHGRYESEFIYGDGNAGLEIARIIAETELGFQKTIQYT